MNEEMNYDEMSILEKYEHIRKKLKTDNKEILLASRKFIEERLETEEKRRNLAENRATAMLGIIGVFAGLIFRFRRSIQGTGDLNYFLLIFYLASIAFLLKAGYYGIRVLWPDKVNRLNSTLVYDMTEEDELFLSLKKEIAWKIWEYKEQINPNSQKLFFFASLPKKYFNFNFYVYNFLYSCIDGDLSFFFRNKNWIYYISCNNYFSLASNGR